MMNKRELDRFTRGDPEECNEPCDERIPTANGITE